MSKGSKSFSHKLGARFYIAAFLIFALCVYFGIKWIPPRRVLLPELRPVEVPAAVVPLVFEEERKGLLDLNRATVEELITLPGIGPVLAARIVAWREDHGPFQSVDDLRQVSGIGEKTLERIRDLVTVGKP